MLVTIRKRWKDFLAIVVLVVLATVVGGYILLQQRLRLPFISPEPVTYKLEMQTAQAVIPGQGQTIRVSGIRIGDVSDVELTEQGRARITVEVDEEYGDLIRTDASAFLRPKTGLKDMFLELRPGSKTEPLADPGFEIPIHNTLPDVNPDEILAGLDADTRSYLKLLLNGAGRGLNGRADDLRAVLKRFEPTYRDLATVSSAAASRNQELRRLVSSLRRLNEFLATKDEDLAELVEAASKSFGALADERQNVSATVRELPSALRQTESTLGRVRDTAVLLEPTFERFRPAIRQLREANQEVLPFVREVTPLIRNDLRPFVREARPLVRDLRPAAADIVKAEPSLTRSVELLNRLFNLIGYNENGREDPNDPNRQEGFLFALAWATHQSANLFSTADAHGPMRPITLGGTCTTIKGTAEQQTPVGQLELLMGLTGVLTDPNVCGGKAANDITAPIADFLGGGN